MIIIEAKARISNSFIKEVGYVTHEYERPNPSLAAYVRKAAFLLNSNTKNRR